MADLKIKLEDEGDDLKKLVVNSVSAIKDEIQTDKAAMEDKLGQINQDMNGLNDLQKLRVKGLKDDLTGMIQVKNFEF